MKNLVPKIALIICSIWITSCSSSQTDIVKDTQANTVEQAKIKATQKTSTKVESPQKTPINTQAKTDEAKKNSIKYPQRGTVKEMVNGDLKCYVTLIDENGTKHNLGATFEICESPKTFLNKKVNLVYEIMSVSDCESAEPCGKSKKESLITKMKL
ncbi:MAG: hypothetical protein KME32_06375 [Mojavia pulchra JT2-VF2]|jgi:Tfp pilus assembly protein PilV|uniref:Uncharacterized protein n=1 Tax=Mojavia pulchra JT2-VF2 TaxID=287848 RepID=A0A951PXA0_9NOST|nr:hypothetical protein [Mojavia pulchra JT2-VF2]